MLALTDYTPAMFNRPFKAGRRPALRGPSPCHKWLFLLGLGVGLLFLAAGLLSCEKPQPTLSRCPGFTLLPGRVQGVYKGCPSGVPAKIPWTPGEHPLYTPCTWLKSRGNSGDAQGAPRPAGFRFWGYFGPVYAGASDFIGGKPGIQRPGPWMRQIMGPPGLRLRRPGPPRLR